MRAGGVAFGNKIYYACMGQKEEIIYHENGIDTIDELIKIVRCFCEIESRKNDVELIGTVAAAICEGYHVCR